VKEGTPWSCKTVHEGMQGSSNNAAEAVRLQAHPITKLVIQATSKGCREGGGALCH
jgi:hypothetical protein